MTRSIAWLAVLSAALVLAGTAVAAGGDDGVDATLPSSSTLIDPPFDDGVDPEMPQLHHGGTAGHLPPSNANVDLVSRLQVSNIVPEWVTDVATYRDTAYIGAWHKKCQGTGNPGIPGGFWAVDIKNPRAPRELTFVPSPVGSYLTEGLHAFRLTTPTFTGDVLLVSQERCDSTNAAHQGGFSLYDVRNPAAPVPLALSIGDTEGTPGTAHSAHTAFGWDAGGKAYVAVMDNQESDDIDIFDITDPRSPVMIRETGLDDWPIASETDGRGGSPGLHDLIVRRAEGKWLMLASYWDAGYVLLDVTDPANPVFLRDTDFPATDSLTGVPWSEGNAHEAEFDRCPEEGVRSRFPCGNVRYIVAADEDFTPYPIVARITSGPFANQEWGGTIAGDSKPISPGDVYAGSSYYVGLACTSSPPPAAPSSTAIAVVQRGSCTFGEKYSNVFSRGYSMMIVFNSTIAGSGCESTVNMDTAPFEPTQIPAIFVSRSTGFRLLGISGYNPANCPSGSNPSPPAVGTQGSNLDVRSTFDGWGYMRLFDFDTMQQLDAWAVPEALDPRYATGFGDLSVHEVTTDPTGDVGYVAYYSAGLRVVDYSRGRLEEVGHYIAPEGSNYWGVELNVRRDGRLYVLASDRDYGLYIFRFGTDLRASTAGRRRGTVGRALSWTSRIVNDGTIGERAAKYTLNVPRGIRVLGASASQGRCTMRRSAVTCTLGRLPEGATARVNLRVVPTRAGRLRATTFVNGKNAEYDVGNNLRRFTVSVRRAPGGGTAGAGTGGAGLTGRPR
jgi:hypothetical protein